MEDLEQTLQINHDWAIDRVHKLTHAECEEDAFSIVQEFSEWLDPESRDHDVFSMAYIGEGSEYE